MRDNVTKVDPRTRYKDPVFIKRGEYSSSHLIWWTEANGFFVTDPYGNGFNGEVRILTSEVEKRATK